LFEDLVFYTAMQSVANKRILTGGWKAGNYTVDGKAALAMATHAQDELGNVILRLADSYIGQRS